MNLVGPQADLQHVAVDLGFDHEAVELAIEENTTVFGDNVDTSIGPGYAQMAAFASVYIGMKDTAPQQLRIALDALGDAVCESWTQHMLDSEFAKGSIDLIIMNAMTARYKWLVQERGRQDWHVFLDAIGVAGAGTQPATSTTTRWLYVFVEVMEGSVAVCGRFLPRLTTGATVEPEGSLFCSCCMLAFMIWFSAMSGDRSSKRLANR